MKLCQECGQPIEDTSGFLKRFCPACVRKHKSAAQQRHLKQVKAQKAMQQLTPPSKTIAEVQREAQALGMSYGQYVAMMRR